MEKEDYKDRILLNCTDEATAESVVALIEPLRDYYIAKKMYTGADAEELEIRVNSKGADVFITVFRPDYQGVFDPEFFDGSGKFICEYFEKQIPGCIQKGQIEFYNADLLHSYAEYISRDDSGNFVSVNVEEDLGFEAEGEEDW